MQTNSPKSNPPEVFTPLNAERTARLSFPLSSVKIITGNLNFRGLGTKALIEIEGQRYKVMGVSCGLPNCQCDAKIIPVKE